MIELDEGNQIESIYYLSYSKPSSGVQDHLNQLFYRYNFITGK